MRENEPFKAPLEDSEYSHKIKLLESAPDKVVREWRLIPETFIGNKEAHKKILRERINDFKRGMAIFRNFETRYGIAIPKIDFVISGSMERPVAYTVVDKIIGENVENISILPQEAKEEIDEFYTALTQYYYDIFQEGGAYWWDFTNKQVVYGHKKDEKENRIYIVDVDPYYSILQKNQEDLENYVYIEFSQIISFIKGAERKFFPRKKLIRAREKLNNIIDTLYYDQSSPMYNHKLLSNLKEQLRD